jgi:hypothetical protein
MKLKWILNEERFIKGVGAVSKGTIFRIDQGRGESFIDQGLAIEAKSKAQKTKSED